MKKIKYKNPVLEDFFSKSLKETDEEVYKNLVLEYERQTSHIELIASENVASFSVLEAVGSVGNNKYAEGYPNRRYYGGCKYIDKIESLAIERAKELFDFEFANVQPHSGSQANQAVFMTFLKPGDKFLALSLSEGGHLTHGAKPNVSGKWFEPHFYHLDPKTGLIDYDEMLKIAKEIRPKLIIAGASAYSRIIDFERFSKIADEVSAILLVDMAHIAGLVATKLHPSPKGYADIVTSTTHKTLRSARGGLILTDNEAIAKKINSAIFPGLQGGPLEQQIAGKAVGFKLAMSDEYQTYCQAVVDNAKVLAKTLMDNGIDIVSSGTDNHLLLIDLRSINLTGNVAQEALEAINIICNKNGVPGDPEKPTITSGIRLGTPAATTRGFGQREFEKVGNIIARALNHINKDNSFDEPLLSQLRNEVATILANYPTYPNLP